MKFIELIIRWQSELILSLSNWFLLCLNLFNFSCNSFDSFIGLSGKILIESSSAATMYWSLGVTRTVWVEPKQLNSEWYLLTEVCRVQTNFRFKVPDFHELISATTDDQFSIPVQCKCRKSYHQVLSYKILPSSNPISSTVFSMRLNILILLLLLGATSTRYFISGVNADMASDPRRYGSYLTKLTILLRLNFKYFFPCLHICFTLNII